MDWLGAIGWKTISYSDHVTVSNYGCLAWFEKVLFCQNMKNRQTMHDHQRACETKIRAAIITGTIDACHERCPKIKKKQPTEETFNRAWPSIVAADPHRTSWTTSVIHLFLLHGT
jgi:hypothetical protein